MHANSPLCLSNFSHTHNSLGSVLGGGMLRGGRCCRRHGVEVREAEVRGCRRGHGKRQAEEGRREALYPKECDFFFQFPRSLRREAAAQKPTRAKKKKKKLRHDASSPLAPRPRPRGPARGVPPAALVQHGSCAGKAAASPRPPLRRAAAAAAAAAAGRGRPLARRIRRICVRRSLSSDPDAGAAGGPRSDSFLRRSSRSRSSFSQAWPAPGSEKRSCCSTISVAERYLGR
jgi:hypothetical protein